MVEGNRSSRAETDMRRRSRCLCRTGGHDEESNSQTLVRERLGWMDLPVNVVSVRDTIFKFDVYTSDQVDGTEYSQD